MKSSLLDTDILSEFLRGNPKVIEKVGDYLKVYGFINLSIITNTIIAGIAITNDLQLVTNNTAHFKRIKGLSVANWAK